jgi:tetratricopeptide (TPR) repeat protein
VDSLIDDLSTYLHRFSQSEVSGWLGGDVRALTQLFPVLERAPAVRAAVEQAQPSHHDSQTLRERAFSALKKLLTGLGQKHSLVLFIDDVQWGDEDSATLLADLLSPPHSPPLFLATTWRSEDAETSAFLTTFLPALDKMDGQIRRLDVQLGELTAGEARELTSSLLDEEARGTTAPERVDAIVRESHGNPFFIDELVRYSRAHDTGPDSDLTSLGDVIFRRIDNLRVPARRLMEVLAVAAQPIDRRIARTVAQLGEDEQSVMATLRGEHLVRVKGTHDYDWLEPYHARIGETIVERLDEASLGETHGELARALEAAGHFDPETVAHHFLGAGESDKAGHYSMVAAKRASEALAFERAARLYEQALELRDWPEKRVDLLDQLGKIHGYLGRGTLAARSYREAAHACETDEPGGAPRALNFRIKAAEQLLRGGEFDEGMDLIEEALRTTGFEPPSSTLAMIGSIAWKRFRLKRRGFDAEPQSRDDIPDATLTRIEALWTAAKMLGIIDPVAGAYYHYHALWEALESGSPSHLALCLCQQAAQESSTSTAPQIADDLLDRVDALLDVCEDPDYVRAYQHFLRGFNGYTDGKFEEGRRHIRQARKILEDQCTGVVWEMTAFQFLEFFPTYWVGDFEAFAQDMPKMLDKASARGDLFHTVALRSWMYPAHLRADAPQKALDDLEQSRRDWTRQGYHMQHFWYLQGTVETALYEGNGITAWSLIEEHRGPLKRSLLLTSQIIQFIVHFLSARSAVAARRRTSGFFARWKLTRRARRAIKKLRASEAGWVDALADLAEAELMAQDDQPAEACELLKSAEHSLAANDMALYARAARRRRGELMGLADKAGTELVRSAEQWMTDMGIENPVAMTAMLTGAPRHPDRPKLPSK